MKFDLARVFATELLQFEERNTFSFLTFLRNTQTRRQLPTSLPKHESFIVSDWSDIVT